MSTTTESLCQVALTEIMLLHRKWGIYDECECTDEQKADDTTGHIEIEDIGYTCNLTGWACTECCADGDYMTEHCADNHIHGMDAGARCPTMVLATKALLSEPLDYTKVEDGTQVGVYFRGRIHRLDTVVEIPGVDMKVMVICDTDSKTWGLPMGLIPTDAYEMRAVG